MGVRRTPDEITDQAFLDHVSPDPLMLIPTPMQYYIIMCKSCRKTVEDVDRKK